MNMQKTIGACALAALLITCGCASKTANGNQATQQQSGAAQNDAGNANATRSPRPSMNPEQLKMMVTFQSLLMMDRQDGLAITTDEAAKLLPIVQNAISAGLLSADDQTKLTGVLTADQKQFLDDNANRFQQRLNGQGQNGQWQGNAQNGQGNNSNGQGRKRGGQDGQNGANGQNDQNAQNGQNGQNGQGQNGQNNQNGQNRGNRQNGGGFRGGNIGDQLVQLLQSKTQ